MKQLRFMAVLILLSLGAAAAWAEPALQTPVQLGESEASVRQKFGEPSKVVDSSTSVDGDTILWYMSRGFSVQIDPATQTVKGITLIGEYRGEGWEVYPGKAVGDVDFSYSFDRVVQSLGSSYQKDEFMEEMGGSDTAFFYWDFDTYSFIGEFWQIDYNDKGHIYPKGNLKSMEIARRKPA